MKRNLLLLFLLAVVVLLAQTGPFRPAGPFPAFADAETPAGLVNSSNTLYSLSHSPTPVLSCIVARNGVIQKQGTDYTISITTLAFTAAPQSGDLIQVWYRY